MVLYFWRYVIPDAIHYSSAEPYYSCQLAADAFESLVWCERYQDYGEFVLTMQATPELFGFLRGGAFLISREDTSRVMIPEILTLKTSADGDRITLTGYSGEGLMRRRITSQKGTEIRTPAGMIDYYMRENIASHWYYNQDGDHIKSDVSPYYSRYCNTIVHGTDTAGADGLMTAAPFGRILGDFVFDACKAHQFGFKMEFDGKNLVYSCFHGVDRSISQRLYDAVIFSEEFQNIGSTEFVYSLDGFVQHAIAGGSGTGTDRADADAFRFMRTSYGRGCNLRELFVDASGTDAAALESAARNAM